jgi:hypothetical protein
MKAETKNSPSGVAALTIRREISGLVHFYLRFRQLPLKSVRH